MIEPVTNFATGEYAGADPGTLDLSVLERINWDINQTAAGAGGASPSGAWNGSAVNFNTDPTGGNAGLTKAATADYDTVVFAGAGEGTGAYNVTVNGTQTAGAVEISRGNVTFNAPAPSPRRS